MNKEIYINKYKLFFLHNLGEVSIKEYQDGEHLIYANERLNTLFIILEGQVEVSGNTFEGKKIYINQINSPDIIGDIEFLVEKESQFDCIAEGRVKVMQLPFSLIREKLSKSPEFWEFMAKKSSGKLYRSNTHMLNTKNYKGENLIATYLLKHNNEIKYNKLSDLSEYFGISYRQLLRIIKSLEDREAISRSKGHIWINNFSIIESLSIK